MRLLLFALFLDSLFESEAVTKRPATSILADVDIRIQNIGESFAALKSRLRLRVRRVTMNHMVKPFAYQAPIVRIVTFQNH